MTTTSAVRSTLAETPPGHSFFRRAIIGAAVATAINATLWALGAAADVGFLVSPLVGEAEARQVGVLAVISTTATAYALGIGLYLFVARRHTRWNRSVMAACILVAVLSALGPLFTAEDPASGLLLAAMHLVTGASFALTTGPVGRA